MRSSATPFSNSTRLGRELTLYPEDIIMNDNQIWPVMGQAAASRVIGVLARHADWRLAACAPYHGLPLAGFLQEASTALLVAVTDGPLPAAAAVMHRSLLETRSDGLIVGPAKSRHDLLEVALGLWRPGHVAWHQPLLPWLADDGAMWLAPAEEAPSDRRRAYKLVAKHIDVDVLPARSNIDRGDGFARAAAALLDVDEKQ
jgi:hypothetical protein